jgi:cell division protein FtsB
VKALAEAQARIDARLETLTARVDSLAEQMAALTARVDALVEQIAALTARIDEMARGQQMIVGEVGNLRGEVLELRYWRRAPAYFARIARRLRVVDPADFAEALDRAVETHVLTEPEREALLLADIVLTGRRRDDAQDVYLLVEVSSGIGTYDVQRAADRAEVLTKLGRPVIPIVAGDRILPDAVDLAKRAGVWRVLDGQTLPPREP